jgi:hypothetical protein
MTDILPPLYVGGGSGLTLDGGDLTSLTPALGNIHLLSAILDADHHMHHFIVVTLFLLMR